MIRKYFTIIILSFFIVFLAVGLYILQSNGSGREIERSAEFYDIQRQAHRLQVDTESLYYQICHIEGDFTEESRRELIKDIQLLLIRLDVLKDEGNSERYSDLYFEELRELDTIFSWAIKVFRKDEIVLIENHKELMSLLDRARELEGDISHEVDLLTQESINDNLILLEREYDRALLFLFITATLLVILVMMLVVQKRISTRLGLSENKFKIIFDESYNFVVLLDREGRIEDINKTSLDLIPYTLEELRRYKYWEAPWWNQTSQIKTKRLKLKEAIQRAYLGETSLVESEFELAPGKVVQVDSSVKPIKNKWGQVEKVLLEGKDITYRKQAEHRILKLRQYLEGIINSMPSSLIVLDSELNIILVNRKVLDELGVEAAQLEGKPVMMYFPHLNDMQERFIDNIAAGEAEHLDKHKSVKRGLPVYENITFYPLKGEGLVGAVIRIDDVSESRQVEEIALQGEKMLSVGGLAAGMAHEINNPLAGMIQAAEVVYNRLSSSGIPANIAAAEKAGIDFESLREYMDSRSILSMLRSMRESGARAAAIVENMLSFAKTGDTTLSRYNMAEVLDRVIELAATDYNLKKQLDFKSIKVLREYDDSLPAVPCDRQKIEQVFLSILTNGAEAMVRNDNELSLRGVDPEPSRFLLKVKYEERTQMVRIEIGDNGTGMSEKVRKRVFEPFFTTKKVGEGTGLGLSVAFFIIQEGHKGTLSVESEEGNGANFIIRLPIAGENSDRMDYYG
ncbi:MAG: PAS domain S-box protein [Spirochaetales bacterium]|nr:PAS domain S-box protein [Spirochaetales bacterium]